MCSTCPFRSSLESDVKLGQAALLRGAVATIEAAHGEASGLPLPAASQAHLHRRRQEDAHLRVQGADAAAAQRDASNVVQQRPTRLLRQYRTAGLPLQPRRVRLARDELLAQTLAQLRSAKLVRRGLSENYTFERNFHSKRMIFENGDQVHHTGTSKYPRIDYSVYRLH